MFTARYGLNLQIQFSISSFFKWQWKTFISQYFSLPCQYHSTNAPYTFIHLPPTLYNGFSPSTSVSPVSNIPPMLYTHSFNYHQRCMMFFSSYFSFSCQYQSTNALYSFIQLPPTLNKVFLPVLQFLLLVSFHQCAILIHSTTTNAV